MAYNIVGLAFKTSVKMKHSFQICNQNFSSFSFTNWSSFWRGLGVSHLEHELALGPLGVDDVDVNLLDLVHGVLHVDDRIDPAGLDARHNGRPHLCPLGRGGDAQRHSPTHRPK